MKIVQFGNLRRPKDEKDEEEFMEFRKAARNSFKFIVNEGFRVNVIPAGLAFFTASLMAMAEGMTEEEMVREMRGAFKVGEDIVPKVWREHRRRMKHMEKEGNPYAKGEE